MAPKLSAAVQAIQARWPDLRSVAPDEPVFLLSAGWRSGSTLLQRMLLGHCLVWGEPYGRSGLIERLALPLCAFSDSWPVEDVLIDRGDWDGSLGEKWTANLFPPPHDLLEAHAAFYRRLFDEPARRRGHTRWGLKEVRYGVEHAAYLRWVFPRARFLFLVRNPYECWASYRNLGGGPFYRVWPDEAMKTPEQFGRHWAELAEGFADRHAEVGGLLIRYEELVAPAFDPRPVQDYLGFELDLGVRGSRIGGSPGKPIRPRELARLHKVLGPLAARLGYHPPDGPLP